MKNYARAITERVLACVAQSAPTHRHKKGGLHTLVGYGTHTETGEEFAIYVDADEYIWCRPRAQFDDPERFIPLEGP